MVIVFEIVFKLDSFQSRTKSQQSRFDMMEHSIFTDKFPGFHMYIGLYEKYIQTSKGSQAICGNREVFFCDEIFEFAGFCDHFGR